MRCTKARRLISDYIDDHLDSRTHQDLERHLEACPDCQMILKDLQKLVASAQKLEEVSPPAGTWFKLKARLKEETRPVPVPERKRKGWFDFVFQKPQLKYVLVSAVTAAVIVGAVALGVRYWKGIERPLGEDRNHQYTLAKLKEAERHYKMAIKALDEAVSSQREGLDPEITQVFRANLEIIDASIQACRKAVEHHPENIEARNYLLFAYRKKWNLLNEMITLQSNLSWREDLGKTL